MSLQIIMTAECQVLCVEQDGSLRTYFIDDNLPQDRILCVFRQGEQYFLRILGAEALWYDLKTASISDLMPAEGIKILSQELNLYNILQGQEYLEIDWNGNPDLTTACNKESNQFRFVSEEDLKVLLCGCRYRWVCGPKGDIVRINLSRSSITEIYIGAVKVDFDQMLQALPEAFRTGELLLNEGWKVWRFVRYNPLIVVEAYGKSSTDELTVLLENLEETAHYQDQVFVLTDCDIPLLKDLEVVKSFSGKVTFLNAKEARERHDYLPRIRLIKDPTFLEGYGPILFSSSGIIFTVPLAPLLAKASLSREIESLAYFYHPEFSETEQEREQVMALLPQQSGNLMIVPDMRRHRLYLGGAAQLFELCLARYPAEFLNPDGQTIINYALRRVRDFSSGLLSKWVLSVSSGQSASYGKGEIICFPITEGARSEQMKHYVEILKEPQ